MIGLDPSINFTGFGVIRDGVLVDSGVIKTSGRSKLPDSDKLANLYARLQELYALYNPNVVVIEQYQHRSTDTAQRGKDQLAKLIKAIGVCEASVPHWSDVVMYKPHEWKGKKSKERTVFECRAVYGVKKDLNNNESDAIMIAHHYIKEKEGRKWRR